MKIQTIRKLLPVSTSIVLLAFAGSVALAETVRGADRLPRDNVQEHFDDRYDHDHYYLARGYSVRGAPRGGYAINRGPEHYWYDRGQWYGRRPGGWVVVSAPIGLFLPVLPPFYTTVWFSGLPYYYANDTYYRWRGDRREYEVVEPPEGTDVGATTAPPANDNLFSYPRNGQSAQQQADDRYECHRSAVDQTHYDPTRAGGGVEPEAAVGKRADYLRAQAACLDARGYSVR